MAGRVDPLNEGTHHGQGSRALRAAGVSGRLRALLRGHAHRARAEDSGPAAVRSRSGFATPDGSAVPYQRIAELTFEDMDALQAGLGSEEGQAAVNDISNFATGGVTIFFAEID